MSDLNDNAIWLAAADDSDIPWTRLSRRMWTARSTCPEVWGNVGWFVARYIWLTVCGRSKSSFKCGQNNSMATSATKRCCNECLNYTATVNTWASHNKRPLCWPNDLIDSRPKSTLFLFKQNIHLHAYIYTHTNMMIKNIWQWWKLTTIPSTTQHQHHNNYYSQHDWL